MKLDGIRLRYAGLIEPRPSTMMILTLDLLYIDGRLENKLRDEDSIG